MSIAIIVCCIIILAVLIRNFYELNHFSVTEYSIKSDKAIPNCKFVILSDLHNCVYGNNNDEILGAIDHIAPQTIFIVGDMINKNNKKQILNAQTLVIQLAAKYKVMYVNGNHEQTYREKFEEFKNYKEILERNGVCFLQNDSYLLEESIVVYGMEIALPYYQHCVVPQLDNDYMLSTLGTPNTDKFSILLVHTPNYFKQYANWGADLTISGHNHGGVVRLPLLGGVLSPQGLFFPKYFAGLFKMGKASLLVSRGIGSHTVNFRLFNKPEIMVLRLENNH